MSGFDSSAPASAPAEALAFTVHSLPAPELPEDRRTRSGRARMLLILAVCAAPVLASYFTYFVLRPQGRPDYGELIDPPRAVPAALPLRTLQGQPVAASTLAGQWLLVVVASGACEARCEQTLLAQRQLRESLGPERDRVDKLWLVDDTAPLRPEIVAAMAAQPAVTVLRVPRAALVDWLPPAAGQPVEAHMYLVDPRGQAMLRTPAPPDLGRFKRVLDRVLRASAAWDAAGR